MARKEKKVSRFILGFSHPSWHKLVEEIKERDGYCCTNCNSPVNIDVYHKYRIASRRTWEVPRKSVITLCNICAKTVPLYSNNVGKMAKKSDS